MYDYALCSLIQGFQIKTFYLYFIYSVDNFKKIKNYVDFKISTKLVDNLRLFNLVDVFKYIINSVDILRHFIA